MTLCNFVSNREKEVFFLCVYNFEKVLVKLGVLLASWLMATIFLNPRIRSLESIDDGNKRIEGNLIDKLEKSKRKRKLDEAS